MKTNLVLKGVIILVKNYLSPGMVECQYENNCNKRSYENCIRCRKNNVAVEEENKNKEKKNWFKRL